MREADTITTGEAPRAGGITKGLKPEGDDAELTRIPPATASACLGVDNDSDESNLVPRPLQGAFLVPPVLPICFYTALPYNMSMSLLCLPTMHASKGVIANWSRNTWLRLSGLQLD